MARKKLSATQQKAKKKRDYVKHEYNLTVDALDFLAQMGANIKIKLVSKPTMRSLNAIRKKYNELRKSLIKKNWVLPTKREMAKHVREEQPYRRSRANNENYEEAPQAFQPDTDYIDELIEKISKMTGKDRTKTSARNEEYNKARLQDAKNRFFDQLSFARLKVGDVDLAGALASSSFMSHVEELEYKYDYEIVDGLDDDLTPMLMTAMTDVLNSY